MSKTLTQSIKRTVRGPLPEMPRCTCNTAFCRRERRRSSLRQIAKRTAFEVLRNLKGAQTATVNLRVTQAR